MFFTLIFLSNFLSSQSLKILKSKRPLQNDTRAEFETSKPLLSLTEFTLCLKFNSYQFNTVNKNYATGVIIDFPPIKFGFWNTKQLSGALKKYIKEKIGNKWRMENLL